jgi:hypothetical protein
VRRPALSIVARIWRAVVFSSAVSVLMRATMPNPFGAVKWAWRIVG